MDPQTAVAYVGQRFRYRSDPKMFDYWFVMREIDGKMIGDCDDFAMTSIWKICDENLLTFLWNVCILHRYRIYLAKTKNGQKHAIGYAKDYWFDNWSKKALSEEEFFETTGHSKKFFFLSPMMIMPMALGLFLRYRKIV